MRDRVVVFLSAILFLAKHGTTQPLQISHVAGNAYVYTTFQKYQGTSVSSNSMYVVTTDGVVLIDTPWDTTQLRPLVDSIWHRHQKKVVATISTHFHDDRVSGMEYLESAGVRTYASSQTIQLCNKIGKPAPKNSFQKDTSFRFGSTILQTYYPGAGHTTDNILVWLESERVLYGGCFIKSVEATGLGNIADADLKSWPAAIKKAMRKFPERAFVISGHDSWMDAKSPEHTLLLLRRDQKNK